TPRYQYSLPTRRSSDLRSSFLDESHPQEAPDSASSVKCPQPTHTRARSGCASPSSPRSSGSSVTSRQVSRCALDEFGSPARPFRSEEHTSELQSPYDLV